jgi:hypothetical protein
MAAVETSPLVDTDRLSSFLDIDGPDLQTLLDSATEGIVFLLQQVQVKAKEFEDVNNAKQLLEINLGEFSVAGDRVLIGRTTNSYRKCQSCQYEDTT